MELTVWTDVNSLCKFWYLSLIQRCYENIFVIFSYSQVEEGLQNESNDTAFKKCSSQIKMF